MEVLAPGKLILSGEHSVVYGQPALAMAVNRYVKVTATPQPEPHISFNLSDFDYQKHLSLRALYSLKNRIKQKYKKFISGDSKIRDVLHKPVELAQVAFTLFYEALNIKLTQGINIHVESTIPIGCGMGSSAATVLSIVHAIANHLSLDLSHEMFLQLGIEAENLQHGFSSGLDLQVSLHGGCIYLKDGKVIKRNIPILPMFLVNTGLPASSTGECVTKASAHFKDETIKKEFGLVTDAMDKAFQLNHLQDAMHCVRENHQLLVHIEIVPQKVQQFISTIENFGGAAKICGAGAVSGDQAGVALVMTEDEVALNQLCQQYNYSLLPVFCESRGVHVV